ncbi:TonB-dependent receptor [Cellvibrio sp. PSBB006]|uniref:TonB-dependent receptor n=1 Tax=Cellvibrio sp. PSBB006 TaxID=1987723 RepID=UPI000B3B6CF9|nr:TonB-dependent receptor [Cellvibrio sp. PSBB006]ARU28946.1 hypothetical protein CBR65_16700 [Cellvibrio sp. PSBB006]
MNNDKKSSTVFSEKNPHFKRSILAMCIMALSAPVIAQDTAQNDEGEIEEIIVSGMRQSLSNAQDIKRNANTVVDSITAKDLGSFPDKSVAEALQRVAGITVNRFAASDDTAHFSTEPSGVIVRGLNQVRTEFNGRDSFSANSSRGLSWGDVSPELMSGVDTYKNQMAELIEGGIAGTVNMRTRVPFDQEGQMIAVSASANYGDLSEEVTPEFSGLYSNRWETGAGEFGFLANFAHSEVQTRSEGVQLFRMNRFRDVYGDDTLRYIPATVAMRDNLYDRERQGAALALQWQDPDEKYVATLQYNRSQYENAWEEYVVSATPADLSYSQSVLYEVPAGTATAPQPLPGTPDFTFDERGLFQTGVMTADIGWWGNNNEESAAIAANSAGEAMVNACYGWNGCEPARRGIDVGTTTRSNNNENMTQDVGFNFKWEINDRARANFDVQYVDSTVENYDIEIAYSSFANAAIDLTTDRPTLVLSAPLNVNSSPGLFSNPNNYYIRSIMDHVEDSEGDELALKMDFEFDFDSDVVESIKVGARYADRQQNIRWSGYNWQNVANTWTGNQAGYFNLDRHNPDGLGFLGYPQGHYEAREFESDFFNLSPNEFVFADMDLLQNQRLMASSMGAAGLGLSGGIGWDPICSNIGDRADELPGTCFTPAEIVDVGEETSALYLQLNFGGADAQIFNIPFSGNIGVRYVKTDIVSGGGTALPLLGAQDSTCTSTAGNPDAQVPGSVGCYLSDDDISFMDGADFLGDVKADHTNILPSFNIKFDLTDDLLLRFAASKAMARPDIGNLRNYIGVSGTLPSVTNADDPLWIKDDGGEIIGARVRYSGDAQNPLLEPIEARQFDLALEYYFADVGSFTATVFHKEFDNYIQIGSSNFEFTNNGVTRTAEIRYPMNGDGAEINGFELAFQRFFDFLPAPFDGLGMQANYTYLDNKGVTNTNVRSTGDGGSVITDQAPDSISVDRLEGLSDESFNLVGMYEKGDVAVRLAYSWRSEYMVTAVDCCVAYPIWHDATGQLDGSIRYNISDNIEISLAGSNLLNEETRLEQQVSGYEDGGLRLPNAWFQNDRRFTLGVRFTY